LLHCSPLLPFSLQFVNVSQYVNISQYMKVQYIDTAIHNIVAALSTPGYY